MICKNCSHTLPEDSDFCQYCGIRVKETQLAEFASTRVNQIYSNQKYNAYQVHNAEKSNALHSTAKLKRTVISVCTCTAITLAAIVLNCLALNFKNYYSNTEVLYNVSIIACLVAGAMQIVYLSEKIDKFVNIVAVDISLLGALLPFVNRAVWHEYSKKYENTASLINAVTVTLLCAVLIFYIFNSVLMLIEKYHKSIRFKEKCFKKINNMNEYLDKGIISKEEYESVRAQIMQKIK